MEFGAPFPEHELQEAGDFLRTLVLRLRPNFGLARKIDGRYFALHNGLHMNELDHRSERSYLTETTDW